MNDNIDDSGTLNTSRESSTSHKGGESDLGDDSVFGHYS